MRYFSRTAISPTRSARPMPSIPTSTTPSGAKPVKFFTRVESSQNRPSPVSRLVGRETLSWSVSAPSAPTTVSWTTCHWTLPSACTRGSSCTTSQPAPTATALSAITSRVPTRNRVAGSGSLLPSHSIRPRSPPVAGAASVLAVMTSTLRAHAAVTQAGRQELDERPAARPGSGARLACAAERSDRAPRDPTAGACYRGAMLPVLAAATAPLLALPAPRGDAEAAERPNILFVFTDDHATHAIGAYGSIHATLDPTPNIDRLAREGMLFWNSFCTNSICGPAAPLIQTGKHSHRNGFRDNGDRFDGDQVTFPKPLQAAGRHGPVRQVAPGRRAPGLRRLGGPPRPGRLLQPQAPGPEATGWSRVLHGHRHKPGPRVAGR